MASDTAKMYIRGTVSNGVGLTLLYLISRFLDLWVYAGVALGLQMVVFFAHGLPNRSEKFFDLSGSFTHLALVAVALMREQRVRTIRQVFTAVASVIWMTRLGTFLYNRILRDGKDERFDAIKKTWLSFMGAWTVQAVWVTLVQLPIVLINNRDDTAPLTAVDIVAMVLWLIAFLIEAAADCEKMAFRNDSANKGRFITSGLWSYSRHPNYFGEILMWCCLATTVSVAAIQMGVPSMHCAWISPAFTALLLLKGTGVPQVEAAGMKKWGQDPLYLHYVNNTSCVVPWFPPASAAGSAKAKGS